MSACPLGKAATASCASRHDRGDGGALGNGGCGTRAGWASGAVEAPTWAASAAGARGWLGVGARPWASESSGASSTRQTVRGGDEAGYGNEAGARMAISRQRTKKVLRYRPGHPVSGVLRLGQTHFGRWRSGDGWFDGQCGRRTVKPCRRRGQRGARAAESAGRCRGGVEHCRMADFAGGTCGRVVIVCSTPHQFTITRGCRSSMHGMVIVMGDGVTAFLHFCSHGLCGLVSRVLL